MFLGQNYNDIALLETTLFCMRTNHLLYNKARADYSGPVRFWAEFFGLRSGPARPEFCFALGKVKMTC